MNLPEINKREFIVQEADSQFGITLYREIFKKTEMNLGESIDIFSQCIINLSKDDKEKVYINECHKQIENLLKKIDNEYSLTYGELVKILASKIQDDIRYVIRLERHDDINKEGGLA